MQVLPLQTRHLVLDQLCKTEELQWCFAVYRDAFRRFHIFTVPLSPARASFILGGRNKHMGYEAYQVRFTDKRRERIPYTSDQP